MESSVLENKRNLPVGLLMIGYAASWILMWITLLVFFNVFSQFFDSISSLASDSNSPETVHHTAPLFALGVPAAILGVLGCVAGVGVIKGKRWAYILAIPVFAIYGVPWMLSLNIIGLLMVCASIAVVYFCVQALRTQKSLTETPAHP